MKRWDDSPRLAAIVRDERGCGPCVVVAAIAAWLLLMALLWGVVAACHALWGML